MDRHHLVEVCNKLGVSPPVELPSRVYGGLLHSMWKLDVGHHSYAVKQLSKDIKLTEKVKNNYELTEMIAFRFSKENIPAISALQFSGRHLLEISGEAFLIYPWIEGSILDKDAVSENHALKISSLLAKMHRINLNIPELSEADFDLHSSSDINLLIDRAISLGCLFGADLKKHQEKIIVINEAFHQCVPSLKKSVLVSHGDLDQKNVLWNERDQCFVIDWESARKLNPTYEIIDTSLNWSGITTVHFNQALFLKMIKAYVEAGAAIDKNHIEAAFYAVLGNWLNWMIYNIKRSCTSDAANIEQRKIGVEQVCQVLSTVIRLEKLMSHLSDHIHKRL